MRRAKQESLTIDTPSAMLAEGMAVSYSGIDGSQCVLGDGRVTSLFAHTLSIQGDCPVKPGMALALMVAIPDSDDHLCLVGAQVASSTWDTFEVDLQQVPEASRVRLKELLERVQAEPSFSYQGVC
ncbi:MAG: hypothetical protein RI101_14750 [Nitrospira sp.]|jgi:hypothetical protein|nr:hypothetical protein [Nitrospira sp.]